MLVDGTHLTGQQELDILPEGSTFGGRGLACQPLVAPAAEVGVGREPVGVGGSEGLELLGAHDGLAILAEEQAQVVQLGGIDALVVHLRQGIEFLPQRLEALAVGLLAQQGQLAQVDILWVERKDADA